MATPSVVTADHGNADADAGDDKKGKTSRSRTAHSLNPGSLHHL